MKTRHLAPDTAAPQRAPSAAGLPLPRALWVAAFVVTYFLCFPHPVGDGVLDLGFVCAWLSPALLGLAIRGLAPARAARVAFLATWLAHGAILHWIYVVVVHYGHAPVAVGLAAPLILSLYPALLGAGLGALLAWFGVRRPGGLALAPVAAALWVLFDHARSFVLTGFPWALLGYAQHANDTLLPLASVTGVYGLSFVSVAVSFALAEAVLAKAGGRSLRSALAGLATAAVAAVVAVLAGGGVASDATATLRVAALQGNIDQGQKWDAERIDATLENYEALTREAAGQGARLIAWPETAFPGLFEFDRRRRERVQALAVETGAALVIGAVGAETDPSGSRLTAYYDSAFAIEPDGRIVERYDKTHLVPFGEYLPLRGLLGRFIRAVATGATSSDVSPGAGVRAIDLALAPRDGQAPARVRVGVPICYELLFPDLMRRFADDGAQVLLGITNDAWYGRTGAPHQFLAITALRAAESGVPLVRAANTGVSAFVGADGRVGAAAAGLRSQIFERAVVVADVPLRDPSAVGTFYSRRGDVFAWACWAAVFGAGIAQTRARRHLAGAREKA